MSCDRGKDPVNPVPAEDGIYYSDGLTIREYYAAKAMQALLSNSDCEMGPEDLAQSALDYTDALLEKLTKTEKDNTVLTPFDCEE